MPSTMSNKATKPKAVPPKPPKAAKAPPQPSNDATEKPKKSKFLDVTEDVKKLVAAAKERNLKAQFSMEKLKQVGSLAICNDIIGGMTNEEIAAKYDVRYEVLAQFMELPDNVQATARAKRLCAEVWLDIGLKALKTAASDQAEIQRAKAIEQHCARRAALYNPQKYSEKFLIESKVSVDANPLAEAIRRINAQGSALLPGMTIEGESRVIKTIEQRRATDEDDGSDDGK